jgi:hypothetical protein
MVDWSFAKRTHSRVMTPVCFAKRKPVTPRRFFYKKKLFQASLVQCCHTSRFDCFEYLKIYIHVT